MRLPEFEPFVQTTEGLALYPFHRLAPGYLVPPADELLLSRFLGRLRWCTIGLVVPFLAVKPWIHGYDFAAFLVFLMLSMSIWFMAVAIRCRGLARTRAPMPRLDVTRRAAAKLSSGFIVFGCCTCLLFAAGSIAMFWGNVGDPTMNIVATVTFATFWLWYFRIALIKWAEGE